MPPTSEPLADQPGSFYARLLSPEERALMSEAPTAADLTGEIAFLRGRVAALLGATVSTDSPARAAQDLARMLELLTRAIAVQSRIGVADATLAQLNDFICNEVFGQPETAGDPTHPGVEGGPTPYTLSAIPWAP